MFNKFSSTADKKFLSIKCNNKFLLEEYVIKQLINLFTTFK